ncbi:hypothetical protein ES705_09998 [subsurface metagenome]
MYSVQKYEKEKEEWKNLYLSKKKNTAVTLMCDLMDLRPTNRYRIVAAKCAHPAIVFSEVINRKGSIKEILLRH